MSAPMAILLAVIFLVVLAGFVVITFTQLSAKHKNGRKTPVSRSARPKNSSSTGKRSAKKRKRQSR